MPLTESGRAFWSPEETEALLAAAPRWGFSAAKLRENVAQLSHFSTKQVSSKLADLQIQNRGGTRGAAMKKKSPTSPHQVTKLDRTSDSGELRGTPQPTSLASLHHGESIMDANNDIGGHIYHPLLDSVSATIAASAGVSDSGLNGKKRERSFSAEMPPTDTKRVMSTLDPTSTPSNLPTASRLAIPLMNPAALAAFGANSIAHLQPGALMSSGLLGSAPNMMANSILLGAAANAGSGGTGSPLDTNQLAGMHSSAAPNTANGPGGVLTLASASPSKTPTNPASAGLSAVSMPQAHLYPNTTTHISPNTSPITTSAFAPASAIGMHPTTQQQQSALTLFPPLLGLAAASPQSMLLNSIHGLSSSGANAEKPNLDSIASGVSVKRAVMLKEGFQIPSGTKPSLVEVPHPAIRCYSSPDMFKIVINPVHIGTNVDILVPQETSGHTKALLKIDWKLSATPFDADFDFRRHPSLTELYLCPLPANLNSSYSYSLFHTTDAMCIIFTLERPVYSTIETAIAALSTLSGGGHRKG